MDSRKKLEIRTKEMPRSLKALGEKPDETSELVKPTKDECEGVGEYKEPASDKVEGPTTVEYDIASLGGVGSFSVSFDESEGAGEYKEPAPKKVEEPGTVECTVTINGGFGSYSMSADDISTTTTYRVESRGVGSGYELVPEDVTIAPVVPSRVRIEFADSLSTDGSPCMPTWCFQNVNIDGNTAVVTLGLKSRGLLAPYNFVRCIETEHPITQFRVECDFVPSQVFHDEAVVHRHVLSPNSIKFVFDKRKMMDKLSIKHQPLLWRVIQSGKVAADIYDRFTRVSMEGMPFLRHSIGVPRSWVEQSFTRKDYKEHILDRAFSMLRAFGLTVTELKHDHTQITRIRVSA